ncbi:MAG: YihY family inner membrane protein, partial [Clostridia bacterium]|nr:YihY family inner membrane protein [Deltaproteobacteria bacterium]
MLARPLQTSGVLFGRDSILRRMKQNGPSTKRQKRWHLRAAHWMDRVRDGDISAASAFHEHLLHYLRVLFMVARIDVINRLKLRAQALTYQTLFAIVPLLAVVFVIFRGFGGMDALQQRMEQVIIDNLAGGSELSSQISGHIATAIGNVNGKTLGVVSIVLLVYSVLGLMQNIEDSFNAIFGVKKGRRVDVRIVMYWTVLTLGPLLMGASLGLTAALQNEDVGSVVRSLGIISSALIHVAPICVTWMGFWALYMFIPNTRVNWRAAAAAAIVAGTAWSVAKFAFAIYTKHSLTTTNIYGTLATLPLFLLWLYVSWMIVLFGAQVAFAFQNAKTYREDDETKHPSGKARERAALRFYLEVARDFVAGRHSTHPESIALQLGIPFRLLQRIIAQLQEGGFIRTTDTEDLVPARDLGSVTVGDILSFMRRGVGHDFNLADDEPRRFIDNVFTDLERDEQRIGAAIDFRSIALRFAAPLNNE